MSGGEQSTRGGSSRVVLGEPEDDDSSGSLVAYALTCMCLVPILFVFPFAICMCLKVVQEYERAVIFRLGRVVRGGAKGPGLFIINPCIEKYVKVDLRTVTTDVPPQEILTRDSVTVTVDAVIYYRIIDAILSVTNVENVHESTQLLASTALRNVLGTKSLSEILSERAAISHAMESALESGTDPWGIRVERVEIKDVRLPQQLQRAMAAEAEAAKSAGAKVIAARGEQMASKALKEAADIMMESRGSVQLRYLQSLTTVAAQKNNTVLFPLPVTLIKGIIEKLKSS